jgi:hypothetical protein
MTLTLDEYGRGIVTLAEMLWTPVDTMNRSAFIAGGIMDSWKLTDRTALIV